MGTKTDEIMTQIDAQRSRLGRNLEELESRLREEVDWRTHYERHPWTAVGIAAGAGLLVGALMAGGRRDHSFYDRAPAGHHRAASPFMDQIKAALIAILVARGKEYLTSAIPALKTRTH